MKKLFTSILSLVAAVTAVTAQSLVSTEPQNKNVVLEEFTGIHCQYCPDGHRIAQGIADANPGRVVLINVHQGSYAAPSGSEPDYRTPFGDPLASQTALTGYPCGTVNRHVFPGLGMTTNGTAMGRSNWSAASDQILVQPSPVNVGIETTYEASTRLLTVNVELYYTDNSATTSNFINVALIQDSVLGPQTNGGAGNNYVHMHMLRYLITGQWGDEVTSTSQGTLISKTYTYTVPEAYNNIPCVMQHCHVAVYVAQSHQEVITGDVVNAIGGSNRYIGAITSNVDFKSGHPGTATSFTSEVTGVLPTGNMYKLSLLPQNQVDGWTSEFTVDGTSYADSVNIALDPEVPKAVYISITPGTTAAVATYRFKMESVGYPGAPAKVIDFSVISGVTLVLVNGSGGAESAECQNVYTDALDYAGCPNYAVLPSRLLVEGANFGALDEVRDVFYNVAWTFPAFKDDEATAVKLLMDQGHNVFVAGQDIGWDIMSGASGSNGDDITHDLYTNYLCAKFIDDGSTANNQLTAVHYDEIFGSVGNSTITDVYGGNMYPDQIDTLSPAVPIFLYKGLNSKRAALRVEKNNYKAVYFGVGLEMLSDAGIRNEIVKLVYEWFGGNTTGIQFDQAISALMGQNFPNPGNNYTIIPLSGIKDEMTLVLTDMQGHSVVTLPVEAGTTQLLINTSGIASGKYVCAIRNARKIVSSRNIIVVH